MPIYDGWVSVPSITSSVAWSIDGGVTFGTTGYVYPPLKEKKVSIKITTLDQITGLGEGEEFCVKVAGKKKATTYTALADGTFIEGKEGFALSASAFSSAIANGNVFFPKDHKVGQYLVDGTSYYKVIAKCDDGWALARTNTRGAAYYSAIIEGPIGEEFEEVDRLGDKAMESMFDMLAEMYALRQDRKRLNDILEKGELPPAVEYVVEVQVKGNVGIKPTPEDAKQMLGEFDGEVTAVNSTDAAYKITVPVPKTSRWGCACDQVKAEDLDGLPGDITSWSPSGCTAA